MGVGTLFGWKKTSPDGASSARSRVPIAAVRRGRCAALRVRRRSASPPSCGATPIYRGALGQVLRAFNAFTPVLGFSLCVVQRRRHRAGVRRSSSARAAVRAPTQGHARRPLVRAAVFPGFLYTLVTLPPPRAAATAATSSTSASSLMFIGFTGQSWTVDRETSLSPGQTLPGRALHARVPRPADGGRQQQAHGLRRRATSPKDGKLHGHAQPGEVHLQEVARVADDRGRRCCTRSATTSTSSSGRINPQTKVGVAPDPREPARQLDLVRLHRAHLRAASCACGRSSSRRSRAPGLRAGNAPAVAASTALGIVLALLPVRRARRRRRAARRDRGDGERKEKAVFGALRCMCGTCPRDLLSTCACRPRTRPEDASGRGSRRAIPPQTIIDDYTAEYGTAALAIPPDKGARRPSTSLRSSRSPEAGSRSRSSSVAGEPTSRRRRRRKTPRRQTAASRSATPTTTVSTRSEGPRR